MRHVFPTSEIPHKWAHQTQADARNPQGNLYFKGATIYSYRDSWPLARIYTGKRGTLVLTNSDRYSSTTAGHQHAVNSAASHLARIAVPCVDFSVTGYKAYMQECHGANLEYLQKEMARLHKEAGRVMRESGVSWRAERAAELHKAMADYLIFFGIRRKMPALLSFQHAYERARRIESPDPASKDARERASARRKQAIYATRRLAEIDREIGAPDYREMVARTDWRLAGAFNAYADTWRGRQGPVMLRVNGDQIETSAGARIPRAAAPMVWERVKRALGHGYKPSGLSTVKIGDYPLTEITPEGELVAGCHRIPHSELRSMARQLGLT